MSPLKLINAQQLRQGMYIVRIKSKNPVDESISKGLIHDLSAIEKLKSISDLQILIDTQKGLDTESEVAVSPPSSAAKDLLQNPVASFSDEMRIAHIVHKQALTLIRNVLLCVKNDQPIKVNRVEEVVGYVVDSVYRNQNALASLGVIRQPDNYLLEHSVNLCVMLTIFGKYMGYDSDYVRQMAIGAILHDVGKAKVPDNILYKPFKLTEEEFEIMKKHPQDSRTILENTPNISRIAIEVAGQHHERINGSGYPDGLTTDQISIHGRMLAIIDVYDALTVNRCYQDRSTSREALRQLLKMTETHLDKELVHKFIKSIGVYPAGTLVCMESGKMGVVLEPRRDNPLKPLVRIFYNYTNRQYQPVKDVDLSVAQVTDRIVKAENPNSFNINLHRFLTMERADT